MNPQGTTIAAMLAQSPRAYASGIVLRQLDDDPSAPEFTALVAATEARLRFLGESLASDRPAIFEDHLRWARTVEGDNDVRVELLLANLDAMAEELSERLPGPGASRATEIVQLGRTAFVEAPALSPSHLPLDAPFGQPAHDYMIAVLEARVADAMKTIDDLLGDGHSLDDVLTHVIVASQREIGRLWQIGDATVADEHLSSRTAEQVIITLHERVRGPSDRRRVIFAAGEGDPHDIGQRIAALHFDLAGWNPIVFGATMPIDSLVRAVEDFQADLVALSVQIGLHVRSTADLVRSVKQARNDMPILVGGRMISVVPDLWQVVGADAGATDAASATKVADELVPTEA